MDKLRLSRKSLILLLGGLWILIGLFLVSAVWILWGAVAKPTGLQGDREEVFRKEFLSAHAAEDPDQFMALFHLDGMTEDELRLLRMALQFEVDLPIEGFLFRAIQGGVDLSSYYDPGRQILTLEPVTEVQVIYDTEDRYTASYLLGITEGRYRIIFAKSLPE